MDVTLVEESSKQDRRRGEELTEVSPVGKGWHIRKEGRRRVLGEGGQHQGVRGQGAEDTRSSGVQEFRSPGVQECRSSGVSGAQEFRSAGVQEFRSSGVQEFRSSGVQEFRSSGDQELGVRGQGVVDKELSTRSSSTESLG